MQISALLARGVELVLGLSGLGFTTFGEENERSQVAFLAAWGGLAVCYLLIGGIRVRRSRFTETPELLIEHGDIARRIGFLLTVAASLTGVGAALTVLAGPDSDDYGPLINGFGVTVIVCAWMLLHVGYARFYSHWTPWGFPRTSHPGLIEFLYFSFTVGVSFATSDVEVQSRPLRWHVLVHSVISFFYNAIVLAVAVSIIRGD